MSAAEDPDISVLVDCPADTDPALLHATVRSVRDQTHRRTEVVVGGGAPRGTYVLPLTAGEILEQNACRNLYAAARRTGADLVAGRWTRLGGGEETAPDWQRELYARSRVLAAAAEAPALLTRPALTAGYCVRRDLYEATEPRSGLGLALAARRIALVPNLVTIRRAAPDPLGDLPAAVAGHRHALALIDDPALRTRRTHHFVTGQVLPYARAFPGLDAARRDEAAAAAARSLDGLLDTAALRDLPALERVAARLLADGDTDGVLRAAYALDHPGTVVSALVRADDGAVRWSAAHTGAAYDVTDLGHQHQDPHGHTLLNRVTRCVARNGRLVVEGRIVVPFALYGPGSVLTATLDLAARGAARTAVTVAADAVRLRDDSTLVWRATVPLTRLLRPRGIGDRVWDPRLRLGVDGTLLPPLDLFAEPGTVPGPPAALPARPRLTRLTGDTWQPYVTTGHHLAVCLLPRRALARKANALARHLTAFRPARTVGRLRKKLVERYAALHTRRVKVRVYHRYLCRLPVSRGTVVFESHLGTRYGDSPRALHEELRGQGFRAVWSYATSPDGFPADARLVRRWSWRYLWALARAEFWVDDQGFPQALTKPRETTYLQTWHGSAYERTGRDEIRHKTRNAEQRARLDRAVARFDHFLVRSEHDVRTLARAHRIPEEHLLRVGSPRNDRLVAARERDEREGRLPRPAPAAALGIPDHRTVVLYAPALRGDPERGTVDLPLDVRAFADAFGDTHVLLVRAHRAETAALPPTPPGTVVDVSAHHDTAELLCLADVLITDHASVMFDYALLDRPILHFAPDPDGHAADRGSYFDLRERAGGPVVGTQDALHRALAETKETDGAWQERRRAFAAEFGAYDDGGAARAVVEALFTRKADS